MTAQKPEGLGDLVWRIVHETPAIDALTFLNHAEPDKVAELDAALCSRSMFDSLFRRDPRHPENPAEPLRPSDTALFPPKILAEIVWHRFFLAHSPFNESARALLTSFGLLGADVDSRDLEHYRRYFNNMLPEELKRRAISMANLRAVVITRGILSSDTSPLPEKLGGAEVIRCLSLDELGLRWDEVCPLLRAMGYAVKRSLDKVSVPALRDFILAKKEQLQTQVLSVTLRPPYGEDDKKAPIWRLLVKCLLPLCEEFALPLIVRFTAGALPADFLASLGAEFPAARVIAAGQEGAQLLALTEAARNWPGLLPMAGADLHTGLTEQGTFLRTGLEQLGTGFVPYSSGAECLLQLPGRWAHARWILGEALREKYTALARTGWTVVEEDIRRDVRALLQGNLLRALSPTEL